MAAKINVDLNEFKRLYAEGMNDKEIAEALGFSSQTARKIRNDIGLPPQSKLLRPAKIEESEFLKHYQQGKSTKEIANELHVTYGFLYRWMMRNKYKVNRTKYVQQATMPTQQQLKWKRKHEKRLELYNKGLSDTQIAVELGEQKSTITQWRRKNNLPLSPKINEAEFLVHYQQGKNTREIADEFHVSYDYLRRWMGKHEYKARRKKYVRKAKMPTRRQIELKVKPEKSPDRNKLLHPASPGNIKNEEITRMMISFPKTLLTGFSEFVKTRGYSTNSEMIKGAIRKYISDSEQGDDIKGYHVGTATIVYDHTKRGLLDSLVDVQHNHSHVVRSSTRIFFNREDCLEIIILDGDGEEIKKLAEAIKTLKGVKFSELKTTSLADKT